MKLNEEENAMVAGEFGPLRQWAIDHQIKVGGYLGAPDLVPVSQAHIMADTESLGTAGVEWLESWTTLPQPQRQVRIPTITDPRGTDFAAADMLKQRSWMLDLERRALAAFQSFGVLMTDTCVNYHSSGRPRLRQRLQTRRFFDRDAILRPGSDWCRGKNRAEASISLDRSPSEATAICVAFSSSARTPSCDGLWRSLGNIPGSPSSWRGAPSR